MKPRRVRVQALKNQAVIADKCLVAECFLDRLRGLIGRPALRDGEGMLFPRCNSVHMWFMRFAIDVVFVRIEKGPHGESRRVSSVHSNVRPWKLAPLADWRANEALELPAGAASRHGLKVGDELCLS